MLSVQKARTKVGGKAFRFAAFPFPWNESQKDLKLNELVSFDTLKKMLNPWKKTHLPVDALPDMFYEVVSFDKYLLIFILRLLMVFT